MNEAELDQEEPKKPGRRERKRIARRHQMLDAAMSIIAEEGVEALTIAHLANAVDAAVGALYRYFPSKNALLLALQQQALDEFQGVMRARLLACMRFLREDGLEGSDERASALVLVLVGMDTYLRHAVEAPSRHRLIDELISVPQSLLAEEDAIEAARTVGTILEPVEKALTVAVGDVETGLHYEQCAHVIWAVTHGLDHFRKRDRIQPGHLQVPQLLFNAQRAIFLGWGIPESRIKVAFEGFQRFLESPVPVEESVSEAKGESV